MVAVCIDSAAGIKGNRRNSDHGIGDTWQILYKRLTDNPCAEAMMFFGRSRLCEQRHPTKGGRCNQC